MPTKTKKKNKRATKSKRAPARTPARKNAKKTTTAKKTRTTGAKPGRSTGKTTKKAAKPRRAKRPAPTQPDPNSITVQPMLVAPDVDAEVRFLEQLGFQTVMKMPGPGGMTMHAVLMMDNGLIHVDPLDVPGMPDMPGVTEPMAQRWREVKQGPIGLGMSLYVMVKDVDKVFRTAERLGARIFERPTEKFWGDRTCAFYDPAGYLWSFATNVKTVAPEDMAKAMEQMASAMPA